MSESDIPLATHTVVVNGPYGTVNWTVDKKLWDVLPAATREQAVEVSSRVIDPFFVELVEDLLRRLDPNAAVSGLSGDWSLETVEQSGQFGLVVWQVGQGVWDVIPDDRRENLLAFMALVISSFFQVRVYRPLVAYAVRGLPS